MTKESSVVTVRLAEAWRWADEDVGAIGWSLSGSLNQTIGVQEISIRAYGTIVRCHGKSRILKERATLRTFYTLFICPKNQHRQRLSMQTRRKAHAKHRGASCDPCHMDKERGAGRAQGRGGSRGWTIRA